MNELIAAFAVGKLPSNQKPRRHGIRITYFAWKTDTQMLREGLPRGRTNMNVAMKP